jgi:CheY-like chemotaxis protein
MLTTSSRQLLERQRWTGIERTPSMFRAANPDEERHDGQAKNIRQQDQIDASASEALASPKGLLSHRIIRVAIAEDEMSLLAIYKRILSISGFDVSRSFDNGKDLSEFVLGNNDLLSEPDVIIVDLRMPIMDGIEAAKIIRAAKPNIKIILASAYEAPQGSIELFDSILRKPVGRKELIDTVSQVLDHE